MYNCSSKSTSLDNTKDATAFTIARYDKIKNDTGYMSYTKAEPNAKRGLLVCAKDFEVINKDTGISIFSLKPYLFLTNDNNNKYTVHPALWEHAKLNMNVGLYRVNSIEVNESADINAINNGGKFKANTGDVFQVRGYDLANMTLVRGNTGWIIMDILTCEETAGAAFEFVKNNIYCSDHTCHDIKGVFYSHSHIDHYGGIAGIVKEDDVKQGNIEIIAPEGFMHHAVSENIYAGNAMNSRAVFMYGAHLKRSPQGQVDNGLGKAAAIGTTSLIAPSEEIGFSDLEKGKRYVSREIDGITFCCQITPGTEAPAEMNVYMPDHKVLFIAENCCGTLHNLYTLRGAEVRDSMAWADYLQETINIFGDLEVVCSSHNWPHFGNEDCHRYLELQMGVYRYMTNATLNLINKGYTIDEVGRMLEEKVPDIIRNEWCNHGFYGTFNHNAKAIYQKYLGWYDGNPANLNKILPEESSKKYIKCMGGATNVIKFAQKAYNNGEYSWAAELLNKVIFAESNSPDKQTNAALKSAKLLCADALEQLGYQSESGPWRNEYLTAAAILRSNLQLDMNIKYQISDTAVSAMSLEMIMQFLGIMFNGYAAQKLMLDIPLCLENNKDIYKGQLIVRHGVLNFIRSDVNHSNSVKGTKLNFFRAFANKSCKHFNALTFPDGKTKEELLGLRCYLEQFTLNFPIVTA